MQKTEEGRKIHFSTSIEEILDRDFEYVTAPMELLLFPKSSGQQWVVIKNFQPLEYELLANKMPAGYDNFESNNYLLNMSSQMNQGIWKQMFKEEIEKQLVLKLSNHEG